MLTTIIYDSSESNGHQAEYIEHLISYLKKTNNNPDSIYIFILHCNVIKYLSNEATLSIPNFIKIISLPNQLTDQLIDSNNILDRYRNSKLEGEYISTIIKKYCVSSLIFMALDYQYILASNRKIYPKNLTIKGIYFHPLPAKINLKISLKYALISYGKRILKSAILKYLSLNSIVKIIFIPEDKEEIKWLNCYIDPVKFKYLPDPILPKPDFYKNTWVEKYSYLTDQPVFLVFGAMTQRKNLINIIRAFNKIKSSIGNIKLKLLIVGKFIGYGYKKTIQETIKEECSEWSDSVIVEDRFADYNEMEYIFAHCRAVLMPYLGLQGSSGILGHAAKHRKPVIVANQGLVSTLVTQYKLGYTVDPTDVLQIANAIQLSINYQPNHLIIEHFLLDRTPDVFAENLLNS